MTSPPPPPPPLWQVRLRLNSSTGRVTDCENEGDLVELPSAGTPLTLLMPLSRPQGERTAAKRKVQGTLRLQLGWRRTHGSRPERHASVKTSRALLKIGYSTIDSGDDGSDSEGLGDLQGVGGEDGDAEGEEGGEGVGKEREAREDEWADAEAKRAEEMIERSPPPPGEYQLQVHVLEGRDLKGLDRDGNSDPMVEVR